MIKVCHLVDELRIGGLERTIVGIVLNLRGYEHEVWCLKKKGMLAEEIEKEKVKIREFNFEGGIRFPSIFKLIKELKKEKFDIIHCHGVFPSIWGRLAAIFVRVPVRIVHCQNVYYGISRRYRIELRFLSFFTTKIIAVSEAVRECLVEFIGINPKKIVVIYNSAPDLMVTKESTLRLKLRQGLGINESDFVVGSIGRLEEHKGHSYLIEAMANCSEALLEQNINCKCLIVGDGDARKDLEAKVKSLGLTDKVIFTGLRRDIENLLFIMDIFIKPSTLREGLPLVLAEAASTGLPLIATDIGGNPEIVKDGVNGFVVPPKDSLALAEKIQHLIENHQERKRMGESSRKIWQEKFSQEEMVKKIGNLYEKYV